MTHYKLVIAYDGTDYKGWQAQHEGDTVSGTLQKTWHEVFQVPCVIIGASRTDAGVHAQGQVARIATPLVIDPNKIQQALNNRLSYNVMINSVTCVDEQFNPRKNVAYKIYDYHLTLRRPAPWHARYVWPHRYPIDYAKLSDLVSVFIGTHDFRSFCTMDEDNDSQSTIRTIDEITVSYIKEWDVIRIRFKAHSFLHFMIRRIVGALVKGASCPELSRADLVTALEAKDPRQTLPKAPACGLVLREIVYK